MLRAFIVHDAVRERWLLLLLHHHLTSDHTTLELLIKEIHAHVSGQIDRLAQTATVFVILWRRLGLG